MASITIHTNPYEPRDRLYDTVGGTVQQALEKHGYVQDGQRVRVFVVLLNDTEGLTQAQWGRELVPTDRLAVVVLPGGGDGSNPLQLIATLAIGVFAPWAGAALGKMWGLSTLGTSLITAGVAMVGNALMSAIFPPPKPPSMADVPPPSPTYSIGAQGNQARLLQPIPHQFGRMENVECDFAAMPYVEAAGNDEFLHMLYCVGWGDYQVTDIRIGSAPVSNFDEVRWEVVPPDGAVTLFPDAVHVSQDVQGLELKGKNQNNNADLVHGGFVVCGKDDKVNAIGVDIQFPRGLFNTSKRGDLEQATASVRFEYRKIDTAGAAMSGWRLLLEKSFTQSTNTPQRISEKMYVDLGRYEVRAWRTNDASDSMRTSDTMHWGGLRGYKPSQGTYAGQTMLALVVKATNQINNNTSRRVSCTVQRLLPTRANGGWTAPKVTRNPMWAALEGLRNADFNKKPVPEQYIDFAAFERVAATCEARGDWFDGRVDQFMSMQDFLNAVGQACRCRVMQVGSMWTVVRDEPRTVPAHVFTPSQMVADSFSVNVVQRRTGDADHIVMKYFENGDKTRPRSVTCTWQGFSQTNPVEHNVSFGVTNHAQAWREGMYLLAKQLFMRQITSFKTEAQGLLCNYADVALVSHDMPAWGFSGEVMGRSGDLFELSEEPIFTSGQNHFISFNDATGRQVGAFNCYATDDPHVVRVDVEAWERVNGAIPLRSGLNDGLQTSFVFGSANKDGQRMLVMGMTPDAEYGSELTLVNDYAGRHTADSGTVPPAPVNTSSLSTVFAAPVISSVDVQSTRTEGHIQISAAPAAGARGYQFEASLDDGESWYQIASGASTHIVSAPPGQYRIRARAVGEVVGIWAHWSGEVVPFIMPPANPMISLQSANFLNFCTLNIGKADRAKYYKVELWASGVKRSEEATTSEIYIWRVEDHKRVGAVGDFEFRLRAGNDGAVYSEQAVLPVATPNSVPTGFSVALAVIDGAQKTRITPPQAKQAYVEHYVYRSGSTILFSGWTTEPKLFDGHITTVTIEAHNAWGAVQTTQITAANEANNG